MIRINFFGDLFVGDNSLPQTDEWVNNILSKGTLNIVNLEAPIASGVKAVVKSGPSLNQFPNVVSWLVNNGFHAVSLANNHMMDMGEDGLAQTLSQLNGLVDCFGAGSWEKAYRPFLCECNGDKVAVFGATHHEFGVLADNWDLQHQNGTAWINHSILDKEIMRYRDNGYHVIVYAHAGVEYCDQPLPEWRSRYRQFIDMGCDAVIGGHPHVVQGWEIYKEKPIVYSLGNFYFSSMSENPEECRLSIVAGINIHDSEVSLDIVPLMFEKGNIKLKGDESTFSYLNKLCSILQNDTEYVKSINDICLALYDKYQNMIASGGYINPFKIKYLLKFIAKQILGKNNKEGAHFINAIRCESHKWVICRAMRLKYDLW